MADGIARTLDLWFGPTPSCKSCGTLMVPCPDEETDTQFRGDRWECEHCGWGVESIWYSDGTWEKRWHGPYPQREADDGAL